MKLCMGCMEQMPDGEQVCSHCGYVEGTDVKEAYYLLPGKMLAGKYIVGKVLGYGGFGVLYIGFDTQLGRKIAIKEYLPSDFATRSYGTMHLTVFSGEAAEQYESGLKSFVDEARRLAKFNSVPEIVDIYDCFMENDTGYIIMEYLEGSDVKKILKDKGKLPPEEVTDIILHVLHGLMEVHKDGIVHRDIAPDNVFITNSGEVKILDFGASRYATAIQSRSLSMILKPGYAPEEQYRSRGSQGPWTDVYAVGATFYRMLTGIRPKESIERLANDDLVKPSELGVSLPETVETALMNALNVRQEYRTKDAETFYNELKSSKVERVVEVVEKNERKIPIWGKIAAAVAGIAILAGVSVFAASRMGVFEQTIAMTGTAELAEGEQYAPDLTNLTVEEAEDLLGTQGLKLMIVGSRYSDEIDHHRILAQNPENGVVVEKKATIRVTMSGGTEYAVLSDLTNESQEDAVREIEGKKLKVGKVEEEFSNIVAKGEVIRMSVESGVELKVSDTTVDLVVSKGRKSDAYHDITVPDFSNMTKKEVNACLKKLEESEGDTFTPEYKKVYSDTVKRGQIVKQEPKAGKTANTENKITLWISKGPETVKVPEVQYKSKSEAKKALEKEGLKVAFVEEYSNVEKGLVIEDPKETGSEVAKGTKIMVRVSLGEQPKEENTGDNDNKKNSSNDSSDKNNSDSNQSNNSNKNSDNNDSGNKNDGEKKSDSKKSDDSDFEWTDDGNDFEWTDDGNDFEWTDDGEDFEWTD